MSDRIEERIDRGQLLTMGLPELRGEITTIKETLERIKLDRDANALAWNYYRTKEETETAETHGRRHEKLSLALAAWEKKLAIEERRLAYLEAGGDPEDPFWED